MSDNGGVHMEHEWSEIDSEVLSVLERRGESSPEMIARELGISVGEVTAFICILAREGKLRIQLVEVIRAESLDSPRTPPDPSLEPESPARRPRLRLDPVRLPC